MNESFSKYLSKWNKENMPNITNEYDLDKIIKYLEPLGKTYINNLKKYIDKDKILFGNKLDINFNLFINKKYNYIYIYNKKFVDQENFIAHELGHFMQAQFNKNLNIDNFRIAKYSFLTELPSLVNEYLYIFSYFNELKHKNKLSNKDKNLIVYNLNLIVQRSYENLNYIDIYFKIIENRSNNKNIEKRYLNMITKTSDKQYINKNIDRKLWISNSKISNEIYENLKYSIISPIAFDIALNLINNQNNNEGEVLRKKYIEFLKAPIINDIQKNLEILGYKLFETSGEKGVNAIYLRINKFILEVVEYLEQQEI